NINDDYSKASAGPGGKSTYDSLKSAACSCVSITLPDHRKRGSRGVGDLIFSELTFTVEHERNSWIRSNPAALKLGSRDSFMHYCIHAPLQQVPKVPCDRGLAAFTCIACLAPLSGFVCFHFG